MKLCERLPGTPVWTRNAVSPRLAAENSSAFSGGRSWSMKFMAVPDSYYSHASALGLSGGKPVAGRRALGGEFK